MTIGCNIWMICLILIWFFYGLCRIMHLSEFVLALRSSVWDVFINFLLIDATDRNKISSDQKRFFIALSLYPLSFFANTPFKIHYWFKALWKIQFYQFTVYFFLCSFILFNLSIFSKVCSTFQKVCLKSIMIHSTIIFSVNMSTENVTACAQAKVKFCQLLLYI